VEGGGGIKEMVDQSRSQSYGNVITLQGPAVTHEKRIYIYTRGLLSGISQCAFKYYCKCKTMSPSTTSKGLEKGCLVSRDCNVV